MFKFGAYFFNRLYMNIEIPKKLNAIMQYAKEEAIRLGSMVITLDHLILGIIRDRHSLAALELSDLGVDLRDLKKGVEAVVRKDKVISPAEQNHIALSCASVKAIKNVYTEAHNMRQDVPNSIHLLLAILKASRTSAAISYLGAKGIDYNKIKERSEMMPDIPDMEEFNGLIGSLLDTLCAPFGPGMKPSIKIIRRTIERPEDLQFDRPQTRKLRYLAEFGHDLTQEARDGKLDLVVGREAEIERVAQILGRRKKNNPILVGEPGAGKSAIAEGLACRIASRNVTDALASKKIISLDIGSVVAGTQYRGQFEERMKGIIRELKSDKNIILFIDEIHTLVGAGSASGTLDAANMLKPALAKGEVQCIGATTSDEFRKIIEKDGALERRFQKVMVEPTTYLETLKILENIKGAYEKHHRVTYTEEALKSCITLSVRYITDRCLPDKAIDVLDEAGSRARQRGAKTVDKAEIEEVISLATKIPIQRLAQSESSKLLSISSILKQSVIGQDEAVDKIAHAIIRNRAGLKDPNRPIGSFLFLGPTGVGKTYLAKVLARNLFDSDEAIIRLDMSEFMEKYSVSRLIGAPPGYVGYDEGGELSEKVRNKPYSVVLLDEIEKASPDIYNLLLQVLDEGRLTDSQGRIVDFKNTILILTSNIGTKELKDYGEGIGYATSTKLNLAAKQKDLIDKAIRNTFSPEFLNRLDDQIIFRELEKGDLEKIVELELAALGRRIESMGYKLKASAAIKRFIVEDAFDPQYGARPLKRAVQTLVEDPLSEAILSGKFTSGATIKLSVTKNQISISN